MKGWIKSIRESKGFKFIAITDGDRDHQLTLVEGECDVVGIPKVGSSFVAEGKDSTTPRGLPEFLVSKLTIVGDSDDTYPIQPKRHTLEFLRSIPELRGRTRGFQSIWKVRHHLSQSIHKFFEERGFYQYFTPIITTADCEGAGETFKVSSDWMEQQLTVSGQLHGEVGMMSLGKIYTFSPCFRAEKSTTKKHLSEFWMIEPEMAFMDLDQTIELAEDLVKSCLSYVKSKSEYEFKQLGSVDGATSDAHLQEIIDKDWKVIRYDDIAGEFGVKWGDDISSEMEKRIVEKYQSPVFITHYPATLKPFYMKGDGRVAFCFDLIFPEVGEIIGGSQREDSYEILKERMQKAGIDISKMEWYLSTRRWGSVPHSGFGLGFERLLMFITKAQKIHDAIPFPVSY